MRIQGTFLSSRAGRRIFWTLLLAAAAPLAMFGVAMHAMLSAQFESQTVRQQVQLTKFAGMGLLDRLLVARTALDIVARTGRVDTDVNSDSRSGRVLLEVAQLDSQGQTLAGSAPLVQHWRDRVSAWQFLGGSDSATLMLGVEQPPAQARPVLMVSRDGKRRDRVWIGEIDPGFLFGELSADASGTRVCVFDTPRRPVFCPGWTAANEEDLRHDARDDNAATHWNLFLRSDFGIDDWTLVSMDTGAGGAPAAAPLAQLSALVAVATLLLVGLLGLIQVRRTMIPLERLIAGTRRLSEHDYSARVTLRPGDEFGELAHSFNHMAERIDHQMQALHVQSSIDHDILNGLNVARVLQRVAHRLEQVVPGAAACVIEFDRRSSPLARVHNADTPMSIVGVARADAMRMAQLPDDDPMLGGEPPPWLLALMRRPVRKLWVRCARAGDELLGMLVVGVDDDAIDGVATRREIAELCDRVSVTLSSADRERRLLERATHDSLTGLANRAGLYESIDARLAEDSPAPFSVLFVDLDRFKEVNDSLGHQVGDELLRAVARRLEGWVPAGTLLARPGGDEFVVVVRGPRSGADALARMLCWQLGQPIDLGGRSALIGASIGMAHHPEHGTNSLDLMRRADMAMYSAKARGGGAAAWFEPALDARVVERAALLADLRGAQARGELELHYQPRIQSGTGKVIGAEALLRWRHPERGFVPAPTFITLMEETGLIDVAGLWVIEQAAAQLAHWRANGLLLESIAVNLSARQLRATDLPATVAEIVTRHGLRASDLELEVTESIFMGDASAAIRTLRQLHDSGIRIALDDFGTGYSSLSYLHKLPIGIIKVDRSFVVELGQRDSALALTRSIVALARALQLRVVAEGVETQQQADLLTSVGCDELQGFLYAPALEPAAFAAFFAQPLRRAVEQPA
ncbi:MAG: putative bifunctional diguanylate cyclase/phosphodiesterase [Burkholderiales bacterium]